MRGQDIRLELRLHLEGITTTHSFEPNPSWSVIATDRAIGLHSSGYLFYLMIFEDEQGWGKQLFGLCSTVLPVVPAACRCLVGVRALL